MSRLLLAWFAGLLATVPALAQDLFPLERRALAARAAGDPAAIREFETKYLVPVRSQLRAMNLNAADIADIEQDRLHPKKKLRPLAAGEMSIRTAIIGAVGLVVVGLLLTFGRTGSPRFRSALGLDELVARWVPDGRTTERLVVLWVICVFLIAASLWLTPAPFPLP